MNFFPINNTADISSSKIFVSPSDTDKDITSIQGVWINPLIEEVIWHYNYFNGKRSVGGYTIIKK